MSTSRILTAVLAAAALGASGAMAGSWPPIVPKKVGQEAKAEAKAPQTAKLLPAASNGFEYIGGESMYQLAQHKYEFNAGRVAHARDCPMTVAVANVEGPRPAVTPSGLPGA